MLRIAICDDDRFITTKIENILLEIEKKEAIEMELDVYFDGSTLHNNMLNGKKYDIIYLDIEMKLLNGIDTAKLIREKDMAVILIYISNYETYMKELFEVEPFRFISKPINIEIFIDIFMKAYKKINVIQEYFEFRYDRVFEKVLIKDIHFFESEKRIIFLYTNEEVHKFYGKLNDVEEQLKNSKITFLRIHRSYLVNYNYIKRIGKDTVEMVDGTIHEMSVNRQKIIKAKYCKLIGGDYFE